MSNTTVPSRRQVKIVDMLVCGYRHIHGTQPGTIAATHFKGRQGLSQEECPECREEARERAGSHARTCD